MPNHCFQLCAILIWKKQIPIQQPLFSGWLSKQRVNRIEKLGEYRHRMHKIGGNLEALGFPDENQALKEHVEEIEKHVKFMEQLKKITSNIDNLIKINRVTKSTPVLSLNSWLQQIQELKQMLDEAVKVTTIAADEVRTANQKLAVFQRECMGQIESNKKRIADVFNIESLASLSEIASWRTEIAQIIEIYKGYESDVEDLKEVQIQMDTIEKHYKLLDNMNLPKEPLLSLYEQCLKEAEALFVDDVPPLDNELIYAGIMDAIEDRRANLANEWLKHSLPDMIVIRKLSAGQINQYLSNLYKMPPVLSAEQMETVNRSVAMCDLRLDELDVEGVMVKFQGLSDKNKRTFVGLISEYWNNENDIA